MKISSKAFALVAWGLAGPGSVLYVVAGIYLPKQQYGAAAAALIFGAVLYGPWLIACREAIHGGRP